MSRPVNTVTFRAGYDHLIAEGKHNGSGYVNLAELKSLLLGPKKS